MGSIIFFFAIMIASAILGIILTAIVLFALFLAASGGILSISVLVGIQKRSVSAGFRTLVIIVCSLGGIMLGVAGFWLINKLIHAGLGHSAIVALGSLSGLLGGILLGILISRFISALTKGLLQKLAARIPGGSRSA